MAAKKNIIEEELDTLRKQSQLERDKAKEFKAQADKLQNGVEVQKTNYVQAASKSAEATEQVKIMQKKLTSTQKETLATVKERADAEAERVRAIESQLESCREALEAAKELAIER
eukprot:3522449-Pleurochrysis_carterae.AAC.1